MYRDSRARITVPDVVFALSSLMILGALTPVFYDALNSRVGDLSTGDAYLFQLIVPLAILVLFMMLYVKATAGVK